MATKNSPRPSTVLNVELALAPAMLTLVDPEGFPLPMPKWLPWQKGKASVTFHGLETFVGEAHIAGVEACVYVERALPAHPLLVGEPLRPDPATKNEMLERIDQELARRGLPLPQMPPQAPAATDGAVLRAKAAQTFSLDR